MDSFVGLNSEIALFSIYIFSTIEYFENWIETSRINVDVLCSFLLFFWTPVVDRRLLWILTKYCQKSSKIGIFGHLRTISGNGVEWKYLWPFSILWKPHMWEKSGSEVMAKNALGQSYLFWKNCLSAQTGYIEPKNDVSLSFWIHRKHFFEILLNERAKRYMEIRLVFLKKIIRAD